MKAIFKPFFALCGMIALSTALSADSRVSSGGGAASSGAAGFLYSDYLQTASDEGHELGFQGSFVVAERRSFLSGLADIGGGFSGRVLEEVQSLPLREWGLHALGGGIFEGERPAHRRALLERGWRLADWLADETLLAATEGGRASGFIRTFELDVRSELGGRRAQVGLNVLGALRERNDDAVAWQLRGFKSSKGTGGNAGLIYRRLAGDALAGANVFLDYETYSGDGFWRWSGGTEFRSEWVDVFGNVYKAITGEKKDGIFRTYTADGYELELNVHSPDVPWLTGEATYYNWKGKYPQNDDKDESGVRWGVKLAPWAGLEFGLEYEKQDKSKKKEFAGRVSYRGNFGGVDAGQSGGGGAFEARDWFFAPAEREYSQRIRKVTVDDFLITVVSADDAVFPIEVRGSGISMDIARADITTFPHIITVGGGVSITITHEPGAVVFALQRTGVRITTRSEVEFSFVGNRDIFRLNEGSAEIVKGAGINGDFVFEAQQYVDENHNRRFALMTTGDTLEMSVDMSKDGVARIPPPTARAGVMLLGGMLGENTEPLQQQPITGLMASTVLVQADTETPPRFFATGASANLVVVATLTGSGGVGTYTWAKAGGQLEIDNAGVVSIPANESPSAEGKALTLTAVVDDSNSPTAPVATDPLTVGFTIVYRTVEPFAVTMTNYAQGVSPPTAGSPPIPARAFHPSGGISLVVATLEASGGIPNIDYTWTGTGELQINNAGVVWIPASENPALPGRDLTVRAVLDDNPNHGGTEPLTVDFTVRYEARDPLAASAVAADDNSLDSDATPPVYYTESTLAAAAILVATVQHSGGGGTRSMERRGGNLMLNPASGELSIPAGSIPSTAGLLLSARVVVEDDNSDDYGSVTPDVTVDFTVVYRRITPLAAAVNYAQGISPPTAGPPPLPARAFHDSGGISLAVATLEASGGVGGNTWTGTGQLEVDNSGAVWIPASQTPTSDGRILTIRAILNDSATHPSTGRTEPVTVDLTVRYEIQSPLAGDIEYASDNNLNRRESPPAFYVAANFADGQHIVATVRHTGGGGDRDTFRWQKAADPEGGQLEIDRASGEVRIPSSAVPTPEGVSLSLQAILNDDPTDPFGAVSAPLTVKLTVVYRLIAGLAARINIADGVVPGSDAITSQIQSGGTYTVTLTHDENGNRLSSPRIQVVQGPEQSKFYVLPAIPPRTFTRLQVSGNPPVTTTIATTIPGRPAQTMTTGLNVIPASPALLLRPSGAATAIIVATMRASGGGGSYRWRAEPGGGLLVNPAGVVRIPGGEVPTENGQTLTVRVILNDDDGTAAGMATDPVTVDFALVYRTGLSADRRGKVTLASYSFLDTSGDVPVFYSDGAAAAGIIAATLQSNGRQANEIWSNRIAKLQGQLPDGVLDVDSEGVVRIPGGTEPTADGKTLTLGAVLDYNLLFSSDRRALLASALVTLKPAQLAAQLSLSRGILLDSDQLTVGFTLAYRLRPLASWEHFISGDAVSGRLTAWGLADSPAIPLATAVIDGRGVFSVTRIAGGLDAARQPSGEWAAIIPANTAPGGELTLAARVAGLDSLPARTVGLTAVFNALTSLRAEVRRTQIRRTGNNLTVLTDEAPPSRLIGGVINVLNDANLFSRPSETRFFALTPIGGAAGGAADYEFSAMGAPTEDFMRFDEATGEFFLKQAEQGNDSEVFVITVRINDKGLGSELTPPLLTTVSIKYLAPNTPLPSYPPVGLTWTNEQTSAETSFPPPPSSGDAPFTTVRVDAEPGGRVSLIAGRFMATGGSGNVRVELAEILPLSIPQYDLKLNPTGRVDEQERLALQARYLPLEFLPDGRVRIEATCIDKEVSIRVRVSDAESGASQIFRAAVATEACPPPAFSDLEVSRAGSLPRADRNKLEDPDLTNELISRQRLLTRGALDGSPVDVSNLIRTFHPPGDDLNQPNPKEYVILKEIRFKDGDRDANLLVERGGDRFGLRRTNEGVYALTFKQGQRYNTGNNHAVLVLRAQNRGGGSVVRTEISVDSNGNRVARLVTTTVAGNPEFAAREPRRYTLRIFTGSYPHFNLHIPVGSTRFDAGRGRLIEDDIALTMYGRQLQADLVAADIWVVERPSRSNIGGWFWRVLGGSSKAELRSFQTNSPLRRLTFKSGQRPDADGILRATVLVNIPDNNIQTGVTVSVLFLPRPVHVDLKGQLPNGETADLSGTITIMAASAERNPSPILALQNLGLNLDLLQPGHDENYTSIRQSGGALMYESLGSKNGRVWIPANWATDSTLHLNILATDGGGGGGGDLGGGVVTESNDLRRERYDRTYRVTVAYIAPPMTMATTMTLPPLPRRDVAVTAHLSDNEGMRVPGGRILDFYAVVPGDPGFVPSRLQQPPLQTRLAIAEVVSQGANTLEIIGDDLALDGGTLYIPAGALPSLPGQPTTLQSEVVVADVADLLEPTTLTVRGRYLATSGRLAAGAEDNSGGALIAEHLMYAIGATSSPVAVASITASRPPLLADTLAGRTSMVRADPSNLAYRALGDFEVDAQGKVLIPADVAPLTPPNGQLLTGAIVVSSDAQNFDFAPTTVSITVRYVLAEPLGTLQMKAVTSPKRHVLGKTDANGNLDFTGQRLTTFNSHSEAIAFSGVSGDLTRGTSAPLTIAELSIPNAPAETLITSIFYRTEITGGSRSGGGVIVGAVTNTLATITAVITIGAQIDIVSRRNIGGIETEVPGGSGLAVIKEGGKTLLINPTRQAYGELFTATLRVSDTNDNALSRTRPASYYTLTAVHMLSVEMDVFGPDLTTPGSGVMYYSNVSLTNGALYHKGQRRVALLKPRAPSSTGGRSQLQPDLTRVDTPGRSLVLEAESIGIGQGFWKGKVEEFVPGSPGAGYVLQIDGAQRVVGDCNPICDKDTNQTPEDHPLRNKARVVWKEKGLAPGAVSRVLPTTLTVSITNVAFTLGVAWKEGEGSLPVFQGGGGTGRTTLAITVNAVEGQTSNARRVLGDAVANVRPLDAFRPAIYYPPGTPYNSMIYLTRTIVHNPGDQFAARFLNPFGTTYSGPSAVNSGGPVHIDFDPDDNIPPNGEKIFFELGWSHRYPGLGPHAERTTQGSDHYLWVKVVYQTRPIALSIRTPRTLGNTYLRDQGSRGENDPYIVAASRTGELGTVALFHVRANDGAHDNDMTLSIVARNGFHVENAGTAGRSWPVQISTDVQANGQTLTLIAEVTDGDSGFAQYTDAQRITLRAIYGGQANPADPRVRGSFSAHGDAAETGVVANALEYTRRFPNVPLSLRATLPINATVNLVNLSGGSDADSTTPLKLSIILNTGFSIPTDDGRAWTVRIDNALAGPPRGQTLSLVVELDDQGPAAAITRQPATITLRAIYGTPPDILEAESKVGFISPADSALRPANIADRLLGVGETPPFHRRRSLSRPRLALAPFPASGGG